MTRLSMSNLTQNVYSLGYQTGHSLRNFLSTSLYQTSPSVLVWHMRSFPRKYKEWWMRLVEEDPTHVLIETALILFVIYMLVFKRARDWRMEMKEKLSKTEKESLLEEWKPAPLVPDLSEEERKRVEENEKLVVKKVRGAKIVVRDGEKDRTMLNMASHDYLGMSCNQESVKEVSRDTLKEYGCGACGPRGFYGTIDKHLYLEDRMAEFCGAEAAIMYSDGASAVSSTVAAFAKRGDLLVVDEGIYDALHSGVTLSRANVHFFKHNDMDDLRRILRKIHSTDSKNRRKTSDQRRFIVVEALYKNFGDIAPLDQIIQLKNEFCYRLILDESFSFGVLGKTGKGAIEFFGKQIMRDVEIVTVSLENSLGAIGGMSVGSFEVVDHQRLSGAGYCFSAAAPPFVASAAMESLRLIRSQPELLEKLARNRKLLYEKLRSIPSLKVVSDELSPVAFVRLDLEERDEEVQLLDRIAAQCREEGVAVISTGHVKEHLRILPPPVIRMGVTAAHEEDDVEMAVVVFKNAVKNVLQKN